ncbi:MAG: PSD1 and planctomycete cytochrome C domain-containing protein [Armatimonadota bacterium]
MRNGEQSRLGRVLLTALLTVCAAAPFVAASAPEPAPPAAAASPEEVRFFEARVRPLLAKHCTACHSAKVTQGGLRLDDGAAMRKGGDGGPAVVPGEPEKSLLLKAVSYADTHLRMPPAGKLSDAEIRTLTEWVERGAAWPAPAKPAAKPGAAKRHWSFQPLRKSDPPAVKRTGWPTRRIDHYLLARLEKEGFGPASPTDRRTLLRRVSFDLTGLPPTPEEIEAFVADRRPDAYRRVVERLLASPHYGERWGRHWLDLARYADVLEAWAQTDAQPWLYRDWVVDALNRDVPYDRFVKLQLSADEMPGTPPADLAALGFLGLSPSYWKELKLAPDVIKTVVAEEWEERIHTVSSTLLGLTVACARCHDHKFDPISAKDYYALAGVFASTRLAPRPLVPEVEAKAVLTARAQVKALEAEAQQLQQKEPEKAESLKRKASALRATTPHFDAPIAYAVETASVQVLPDGPDRTRVEHRDGVGQDVPMQLRGNVSREGEVVPRRFLAVLSRGEPARFSQGSGRRELAEAVFRDSAPLAARVIVNRVWRHYFGRGLVETPSDFGTQGDRPSHPELLDDLAGRFIAAGWSLKWLHREIVLSSTYRQGGGAAPKLAAADPDNRLLGRMIRRRLEVEAWRDAILSASGQLDRTVGGAPQELSAPANVRRTLYGVVKRRDLDHLLRLYDFPDPVTHSAARFHTTTPLQQLYVLNSEFIAQQATALAARLEKEAPAGLEARIERAHQLLYGRAALPEELESARRYLLPAGAEEPPAPAWQEYLEVLLARNELMYLE